MYSVAPMKCFQLMDPRPRRGPDHNGALPCQFVGILAILSHSLGLSGPLTLASAAQRPVAAFPQLSWGSIAQTSNSTATILLQIRLWPPDGRLTLPTPFPNITAANLFDGLKREQLQWAFNADASQLQLEVPAQAPATLPAIIALETAENTAQFTDGRIVFSALDAR